MPLFKCKKVFVVTTTIDLAEYCILILRALKRNRNLTILRYSWQNIRKVEQSHRIFHATRITDHDKGPVNTNTGRELEDI